MAQDWQHSDDALFQIVQEKLYTCVLSDAMDELGFRHQAMHEKIRPLHESFTLVGWAKTILAADVYHMPEEPYKLEIASIDSLRPNEVVVAATGDSRRTGFWGELLSTAARARGARGAVMDGLVRDVKKIVAMGFPVFASGIKPVDSRGRSLVIEYDCPVRCGDVDVQPGDLVVADYDGVVVVPRKVTHDVIARALDKVHRENKTREMLMQGFRLRDVYDRYGVL